jgi:hypothetical protein
MNTNEEHNSLDDAFRKGIGRLDIPPLPINLDGMRADTLASQLVRASRQIQRLRGVAGFLLLLLGGSGLSFYQYQNDAKNTINLPIKAITVAKIDTVYITKIEKVFVPAGYENTQLNAAQRSNMRHDILQSLSNNELSMVVKYYKNQLLSHENLLNNSTKNTIANRTTLPITTINDTQNPESIARHLPPTVANLNFLDILPMRTTPMSKKTPDIHYKPTLKAIKAAAPKMTLAERFSVSAHVGIENSSVDIRRDQIDAFQYDGNENISSTKTYGLRLGIRLTNRLSVETGYEDVDYTFQSHNTKKMMLKAELLDGQPAFVYRSIFGSAVVPNQELTKQPQLGDGIILENEENHIAGYDRIPLILRYDLWDKPLYYGFRRKTYLTLYGLLGGVYSTPSHQQLNVEIYESNGHDFYTSLSSFKNTSDTWGINLGAGAELMLNKKLSLWLEPSYQKTLTSMVQGLPLRTFPNSFGLRFGVKYQFVK